MTGRSGDEGSGRWDLGRKINDAIVFLRFGVVGIVTALVYLGLLIGFVELELLSVSIASAVAYVLAVSLNYCLHYFWAFDSQRVHKVAMRRYLVMVGTGFMINWAGMTFFAEDAVGFSYLLVQLMVLAVVVAWNYLLSFTWVFR